MVMVEAQRVEQQEDKQRSAAAFILEDVRRRANLPPNITPQDAIRGVMCTLSQHVSGGEARHLWSSLPKDIQMLVERCMLHRGEQAQRFDRDLLLLRIADHLGVPLDKAEEITSAVLAAITSRLPPKEISDVASQLPYDLKDLWSPRKVSAEAPLDHPLFMKIEQSVRLPEGVKGTLAFKSVMCQLTRRLTLGEARHLFAALPREIRPAVEECIHGRGEHPELFGRQAFLGGAETVARTVFKLVEQEITADVFRHVMAQLPRDLLYIWAAP
jgi:uncharacterized protein (DUF2267 family)